MTQSRNERQPEMPAVRTTIVGGRPPGCGQELGAIPHGLEVLLKKAAVDAGFRQLLLEKRAAAAERIGLQLVASETMMLNTVPTAQLERIIAGTKVPDQHRAVFLGTAAALMLATFGVALSGCGEAASKGVRPDRPPANQTPESQNVQNTTRGVQPDRPVVTDGIRPDRPEDEQKAQPPAPTGIRPDRPQ